MLHRHILSFALAVTFAFGQFGLVLHDVSHLNQHIAALDSVKASNANINTALDGTQLVATKLTRSQLPQSPSTTDYYACEKCTGFASVALGLPAAALSVASADLASLQHSDVSASLNESHVNHHHARAPPHVLV